jgi:hypothetical protein
LVADFAKFAWAFDQPALPARLFLGWRRPIGTPVDFLSSHVGGLGCVFGARSWLAGWLLARILGEQSQLDQAADGLGARRGVVLSSGPSVKFGQWGGLQPNADQRALTRGCGTAFFL